VIAAGCAVPGARGRSGTRSRAIPVSSGRPMRRALLKRRVSSFTTTMCAPSTTAMPSGPWKGGTKRPFGARGAEAVVEVSFPVGEVGTYGPVRARAQHVVREKRRRGQ